MAIEIKYSQAVRIFLKHLQQNNMTNRWLESFRQTLQGSFKRFIASELTIYPLWMKAPNGKPTNLTESQWIQVRTLSFKKWFGYWEGAEKGRRADW